MFDSVSAGDWLEKRAGFLSKDIIFEEKKKKRKEKHDHACIQSRKSLKIWGGKKMADSLPITGTFLKLFLEHLMQR